MIWNGDPKMIELAKQALRNSRKAHRQIDTIERARKKWRRSI